MLSKNLNNYKYLKTNKLPIKISELDEYISFKGHFPINFFLALQTSVVYNYLKIFINKSKNKVNSP